MKRKNFPGRKNQRRKVAVENAAYNGNNKKMLENTERKLLPPSEACLIRTKKRRD